MSKKKKIIVILVGLVLSLSSLAVFPVLCRDNPEPKNSPAVPKPVEILAAYINEAKFEDFPPEVVEQAKYLILDSIGCALGGTQLDLGQAYLRFASQWKSGSESTIIGSGIKGSRMNAAFVNTQLASVLDFDDTYDLYSPGHPGCGLIQTALAVGESVGASGKEVLTAIILGFEVCLRIGRAEGRFEWQSSISLDSMTRGIIAVNSRLLNLSQKQIYIAMQHAGELQLPRRRQKFDLPFGPIPAIKNDFGTMAVHAIIAVQLAQQEVNGWEGVLYGDFKKWFLAGEELEQFEELTKELGHTYRLMEVSLKPVPSCRLAHGPVTALWKALDNQPVKEKDVSEIIIIGVERLNRPQWDDWLQSQFSIQCVMAQAASGLEPGPKWFTTGRYNDPETRALAAKVKWQNDPKAEELEIKEGKSIVTVKVKFADGSEKEATITHVKGAPENPLTHDEIKSKFRANTIDIMSEKKIFQIIDTVLDLEKLSKVSDLTKRLTIQPLAKKGK